MAHFVVSFRIDKNSTYQERYDSLRDKVNEISSGYVWDETTSLYVFGANGTAGAVADALYYGSKLVAPSDTLLVIDLIRGQYAGYGIKYEALLAAAVGLQKTA